MFPALELTLGHPTFQALLLLDADFPPDRLDNVLQALSLEPTDVTLDRLPSVEPLDHIKSLVELHDEFDTRDWLRGRYIVFPNVTDGGYKTFMREGMKGAYSEMPCVGGYVDGKVEAFGVGHKKICDGLVSAWGNKRIAVFQTSDSRSATFEKLGEHSTWVKWTTPSAEALRQACLAQESRVSQQEPRLPNVTITGIDVSSSKFLGPFSIEFNQQYTAIIGGRGTGKSTILGYLRWALCDQPSEGMSEEETEAGRVGTRQRRLIDSTLAPFDARVEVRFSINGLAHVVRRQSKTGEILLKVGDDTFRAVREDDVRALLPIHAYSQKQLSSVSVRVDELTRFITAPIQAELDEIDGRITEAEGRFRENYATLQRVRSLDLGIARSDLDIRSLHEQAASIRRSLGNLTREDQAVLASKPAYDNARSLERSAAGRLGEAERALSEALTSLDALGAASATLPEEGPANLNAPLDELLSMTTAIIQDAANQVRRAAAGLAEHQQPGSPLRNATGQLAAVQAAFELTYEGVKARSTTHEAKLAELGEVERRASDATALRERQATERSRLGDPEQAHRDLRQEITHLRADRSAVVAAECSTLDELSEGLIHAELRVGASLPMERFRSAVAGSGIRSARIESLFEQLQQEPNPVETWDVILDEIERVIQMDPDVAVRSADPPTLSRLGFPVAEQHRLRTKLTADRWLDLALTRAEDQPVFQYEVTESDYIDFADASAGQQATALLRVLLAQSGPPLIIDQPEDDLDSQVVLDVVERIWTAKSRRQLIFSSHNANLVVNGDAELVVVCENRNQGDQSAGQVGHQGAIDVAEIRAAVTDIMEGGEKAFRLRKEKYGF